MSVYELLHMDCRAALANMADDSVDSVVTDPPYHLTSIVKRFGPGQAPAQFGTDGAFARAARGFMGQTWDGGDIAFDPSLWAEVLRVLKPGGHVLAFSGTRTYHRMAVAVEDAGFEIRDMLEWLYGSGFPKSLDISKALDKAAGVERTEVIGNSSRHGGGVAFANGAGGFNTEKAHALYAPATDAARQWEGWGTALKPAHEPICMARKPLGAGTVAGNVLAYGTGALNIGGCRIEAAADYHELRVTQGGDHFSIGSTVKTRGTTFEPAAGRFPANVCHDGSDAVVGAFPAEAGAAAAPSKTGSKSTANTYGKYAARSQVFHADTGSAARFFYCAKASKRDRNEGCEDVPHVGEDGEVRWGNVHPTVKPTELMRWLCRMVTPPGGLVFDPFTGSGSTGKAALLEGFRFVGAEMTADYIPIARARLDNAVNRAVSNPTKG